MLDQVNYLKKEKIHLLKLFLVGAIMFDYKLVYMCQKIWVNLKKNEKQYFRVKKFWKI